MILPFQNHYMLKLNTWMRKFMKIFCAFVIWIVIISISSLLRGQEPDSLSDLKTMAEAERSFARMAVTKGVQDAFVENFSDDAIIFRPGPVKGRPVWQQRKPLGMMIRWEPEYVDIAASGDFGYSTGPAEYLGVKPMSPALGYGYFVSIWTKQPDGKWKVALDVGTEVPTLVNSEIKLHFPEGADKRQTFTPVNTETEKIALLKFDNDFDKIYSKVRTPDAFMKNVLSGARFYREGQFPQSEIDSVKMILTQSKDISWKPMNGAVANSGDMGYTYGSYKLQKAGFLEDGYYFRVWKKENKQGWKIVIDLLSPVLPQK